MAPGKQLIQIEVDGRGRRQRAWGRGIRVCDCNEIHHALRPEPFQILKVMGAEAMNAYQGDPCRCSPEGAGTLGGPGGSGFHDSPLLVATAGKYPNGVVDKAFLKRPQRLRLYLASYIRQALSSS
jgi:hypothetical protein